MRMPAIFVGHGSPMNAIEENEYTRAWAEIGKKYRPKAIALISAHWYTEGLITQDEDMPKKINDMYGFPKALYDLAYPVHGSKELSNEIVGLFQDEIYVSQKWGIDHGAWSVLVHMYPNADIPVVQISVDATRSAREQFDLGRQLSELRDKGYMLLGSGNVVHNLRKIDPRSVGASDWALEFDDYIKESIEQRTFDRCIDYANFGKSASLSVPTPDHYFPLLCVIGAVSSKDELRVFNRGYSMGSLSMTSYEFHSPERI